MTELDTCTLVIPDPHESPEYDSVARNESIGNLIVKRRPDRVVILGDFLSLDSLSAWDFDKRLVMEGRRYRGDVAAGNKALDAMLKALGKLQERQRTNKDKIYKPELVFCMGNHEHRLDRYIEKNASLEGSLNVTQDLKLHERGFIVIPYGEYHQTEEGVQYTHCPLNDANQAPSGKYAIERVLELVATSTVFGHLHRWCAVDSNKHGAAGVLKVLACGCSFEHTPAYVKGASSRFWRGVALLHHHAAGDFDTEQISLTRLRRLYGNT